ncbi:MAG: rRNA methyltransferase [Anaerosolibacter sp.]|jgi:16S rRNA (guanine527-N7)-methyltransferase|uniref:16S rRNA (guanine(527)-N(7))-methyltransferase RsmG n=1 Tax=Anaerosolibacter sp. TaxID=1872527 RepID=UPI00262EA6BA|nr:16S rRNA (guanine(527)-N(7))-methyltransferase RsmG [Anaerosolibacter sp.]MDF2548638.1 rRNA methyltransferase [Anaerosolibacter sp.]
MNNLDILTEGAGKLGLTLSEKQTEQLIKYKDLLLEWNEKMNLTAITDEKEVMIKHFLDALSCATVKQIKEDAKIIDVGTGAGFPGIPLKIYFPKLSLTLLDSLNKRINFLKTVCEDIEVKDVQFVHGRAEDVGANKQHREKYDIAVARAVAELNVLSEYCLPFVRVGGYFICQKGPSIHEEIERGKKAIEILGGRIVDRKDISLPFSEITHNIVIIEKVRNTPTKFPRKAGTPSKNPLI